MNVLFLTVGNFQSIHNQGIYQDFVKELSKKCKLVLVLSPLQRRENKKTQIIREGNVIIVRIKMLNITKTNKIEKGFSTLLIETLYYRIIKRYFNDIKFDMIVYSTPPITFSKLIQKLKEKNNSKSYLMLKDIFPQNAVDLKMFKHTSLIYKYFRKKEVKTYKISDYIGVMSPKNKQYILQHNPMLQKEKIHIFRNATYDTSNNFKNNDRNLIFKKYNLDSDKVTFIYGGNVGLPQGIESIKNVITRFNEINNSQLIIVGSGTKFQEIQEFSRNFKDVFILNQLPKKDYDSLLICSDIGLIFLDRRFTIPNYPSRLTSYLMLGKPVISVTDSNTDISTEIEKYNCGFKVTNNDISNFVEVSNEMAKNSQLRKKMGENAKLMFDKLFKIENNVENMLSFINGKEIK